MNYVGDDEQIVDAGDMEGGLDCLRCEPPRYVARGQMKAHMDALHRAPAPDPPLPLKPWEHYTIADDLLRESRRLLAAANDLGAKGAADWNENPIRAEALERTGTGPIAQARAWLERSLDLANVAAAHSQQAAAGALLQQHYSARFSELWSPGSVASTSKEDRDAELEAWPGTAKKPAG